MTLIVHIATRFLGGGSERSLADVVRALPGTDYRHVLLVGRDHDPARIRSLLGETEVVSTRHLVRSPNPASDVRAFAEIRAALRRLRPDIVHTIQSKSGILGRAAARSSGVPKVVHSVVMSNFGAGFSPAGSILYRGAERLAASWTDQYVACGAEVRDRFLRAGIASLARYQIVRSSVDLEAYRAGRHGRAAARRRIGIDEGVPVVLFAGALEERKGVHDLAPFLRALRRVVPDAQLLVAGEGPLRARSEADFALLRLAQAVQFLGYSDRLPEAMAAADCLVMLSRAEGLATVLVQAVATGRPFVSFEVDGPRELIQRGAIGAIVRQGDISGAARAVAEQFHRTKQAYPSVDLSEWAPAEVERRYRSLFDALA